MGSGVSPARHILTIILVFWLGSFTLLALLTGHGPALPAGVAPAHSLVRPRPPQARSDLAGEAAAVLAQSAGPAPPAAAAAAAAPPAAAAAAAAAAPPPAKPKFQGGGSDPKSDPPPSVVAPLALPPPAPRAVQDASTLLGSPAVADPLSVLLDYPASGFDFTTANYRALESVLHAYPDAVARYALVAPGHAAHYRFSNCVSMTHFEKYQKRTYDVKVDLINAGKKVLEPKPPKNAGHKFWEGRRKTHFSGAMTFGEFQKIKDGVPLAVDLLWLRLARLYSLGGLFLDFTTLLLGPLPDAALRGYAVAPLACQVTLKAAAALADSQAPRLPPMVLAFPKADPVVVCALRALDAAVDDEAAHARFAADPASLFAQCWAAEAKGAPNGLEGAVAWQCEAQSPLFDPANRDAAAAAVAAPGTLLAWIGPEAHDGVWRDPPAGSLAAELWPAVRGGLTRHAHVSQDRTSMVPGGGGTCPTECSRFVPTPGTKQSAKDVSAAAHNCAPKIIIPGVQKGASSFLFHFLAQHPQMVKPLRGANFKETGAYLNGVYSGNNKLDQRVSRFPHLEPDENQVTGDATVTYMLDNMDVPHRIKLDSPNVKVVFTLRDPVDRAYSDYRFCFGWYRGRKQNWDQTIDHTIGGFRQCFNSSDPGASEVPNFYRRCKTEGTDAYNLIKKGMYYHQVKHWIDVLGKENVMVMTSEQSKKDQENVINRVVNFTGLCPYAFDYRKAEHVTGTKLEDYFTWSEPQWKALKEFYAPWNKKLYDLIGQDLGWEALPFKP